MEHTIFWTVVAIVLICYGYTCYLVMKYKLRLHKKDKLLQTAFQEFPTLMCEDPTSIAYFIKVTPEYDSEFVRIKYECDDIQSRVRLYSYLCKLNSRGAKFILEDTYSRVKDISEPGKVYSERRELQPR